MSYAFKMQDYGTFMNKCVKRLKKGQDDYGDDWLERDLLEDMEQELLDLSNYAYLLYRKIQLMKSKK